MNYREILRDLVAFPTVSSDSNLVLIDYVRERLESCGFTTRCRYNAEGDKANLIAHLGPEREGGILLAGHTDVVPVADQNWNSDPFVLVEEGGRWIGRGTTDMKGYLALVLQVCGEIDASALKFPLSLAFTYDEEIGCVGAKALAREFAQFPLRPAFVLIGEPTNGEVVAAHKGIQLFRTRVTGKAAHASRPDLGINAIEQAARLISRIHEVAPADRDDRFKPDHTTVNVGIIEGGSAPNIVASRCQFHWEVRPIPGLAPDVIAGRWQRLTTEAGAERELSIDTETVAEVPGLETGPNWNAVEVIKKLRGSATSTTAPFVTEGGLYQQHGIPAVICGPGEIEQAHQPNESVSDRALQEHLQMLQQLIATQLTPKGEET